MTAYKYDWLYRSKPGPMTFQRLLYEAIEVCSPELYQRRAVAITLIRETYIHNQTLTDHQFGSNRETTRVLNRLVSQAFVRAYLRERRAGMLPRAAGVPTGTDELVFEAHAAVEAESRHAYDRRCEREAREASKIRYCQCCKQPLPTPANKDAK